MSFLKSSLLGIILFGVVQLSAKAQELTLGFDGLADLASNVDGNGVTFTGATVLACGSSLNCTSFPPFSGRNVVYDQPGFGGLITAIFEPSVGKVDKVSSRITGNTNITMTAYDKDNLVIQSVQTGGRNYVGVGTPNMLLSVTSADKSISKVTFHDSGNTFTIDDFTFNSQPSVTLLDPGHGKLLGDDGIKHYQRPETTLGLREDNLTLAISLAAKGKLVVDKNEVYLTRSGVDSLYSGSCGKPDSSNNIDYCNDDLKLRVEAARKLKLDDKKDVVFVSVHTNGGSKRIINGRTQTFYCSDDSKTLAVSLLNAITSLAPPVFSLFSGGFKDCGMAVLGKTAQFKIQASLIEVLYHNNSDDEALLNDPAFLSNAGNGIAQAIEDFIKLKK